MNPFSILATAASGMEAQRHALDVEARNVAAAEAAGPTGSYARLIPTFRMTQSDDAPLVEFDGAVAQRGSSVDVITEMISVMNASRAYEANASVFDVGKRLEERTIDLGRV